MALKVRSGGVPVLAGIEREQPLHIAGRGLQVSDPPRADNTAIEREDLNVPDVAG